MISIVIPLYNKEKSIAKTLESVWAQTYTDWECIIVNDGSTDKSADVIREWIETRNEKRETRFRVINQENGGVCSARNRGIRESVRESEFIAFLDADDLWDKDYLKEQMRMVNDFSECGMWSINYGETRDGKIIRDVPTGLEKGYRGIVENYFEMQGRVSDLACSSSVLLRKEVFDKVGYFDERIKYAEDTDMWWRVMARYPFAFYDRYMVSYQFDAENRAMQRHRSLDSFLPYYVGKFKSFSDSEAFYKFIERWCAIWLSRYYISSKQYRMQAKQACAELDYSVISPKYRWIFKTPFCVGWFVFQLAKIKQSLSK